MSYRSSNEFGHALMPEFIKAKKLLGGSIDTNSSCYSPNSLTGVELLRNQNHLIIPTQLISNNNNPCLISPRINLSELTSPSSSLSNIYSPKVQTKQRRLHISNIPFRFRETELINLVKVYGTVLEAEIICNERGSKGFGFVTFANSNEAEKAKVILNGALVEGRIIEVNNATAKVFSKKSVNNNFPFNPAKRLLLLNSRMGCKNENMDPSSNIGFNNLTFDQNVSLQKELNACGMVGLNELKSYNTCNNLSNINVNLLADNGNIITLPIANHHVIDTLNRNTIQNIQRAQLVRRNVQSIKAFQPIDKSRNTANFSDPNVLTSSNQPLFQVRTLLNRPIHPLPIPTQLFRPDYQRFYPY